MNRKFSENIPDRIGNTPLVRLRRVADQGSATLLTKLEMVNPDGSVKDRIALTMVEQAEKKGTSPARISLAVVSEFVIVCRMLWRGCMPTRHSVVALAMLLLSSAGGSIFMPMAIAQSTCPPSGPPFSDVSVVATGSTFISAWDSPSGFFATGQNADIMLSGIDFNNTGGPLLFNHQGGIATDGTRLFLADSFNHRVLIWNTLPTGNVAPDLVLGQTDFTSNTPGSDRSQMNMPMQVSTDGRRLAVADSYNDRILIWTSFPTRNGAPADIVINGEKVGTKGRFSWPWGVWTNGQKLVVTGTGSGNVVIWNTFPTSDDVPPDIALTGGGKMGTPRMLTSNGSSLIIGDHNARIPGKLEAGSFFWKTFPTSDAAPFDFYMEDPGKSGTGWFSGTFTTDGRLLFIGTTLYIWNSFPANENDAADVAISGYNFRSGDGRGVAVAGDRVYVSAGNLNKIVVYNSIPTNPGQIPDFAVGSPDVCTNTLSTNYFLTNPVAASNGTSLFASSDYDSKFYVWRKLPGQSGAHPDFVYPLPFGVWDIGINGRALALAGTRSVYVWDDFPVNGELPSRKFSDGIGSVRFSDLRGVALDDRYFYVADAGANKVYVWSGIPSASSEPAFTLAVTQPQRMSSDGTYLIVTATSEHKVLVYPVTGLSSTTSPVAVGAQGQFNGPKGAFAAQGRLFVADTGFNRVHVWSNIQNALAGQPADIVLGENNFDDTIPELGRNKTFWPASVFYDGRYLWVGEYKFSHRLLRFGPNATFKPYVDVADCLFNWAGTTYPALFAPAATSNTYAPYYYRYYSQTRAYLATSFADNHVYYFGPASNNSLLDVGALSTWLMTAGCN